MHIPKRVKCLKCKRVWDISCYKTIIKNHPEALKDMLRWCPDCAKKLVEENNFNG